MMSSTTTNSSGYLSSGYAESLAEFGTPRHLGNCGGWILERTIPGTTTTDGMGCYPLFSCQNWSALPHDLRNLQNQLVSLSLVTDPFGGFEPEMLRRAFDLVIPFKEHFVADLSQPLESFTASKHRYNARRALQEVTVELCPDPLVFLDDWVRIYGCLADRHGITGLRRFSRECFVRQLAVPGLLMFRAAKAGETVGFNLLYLNGEVAYTHLSAESPLGYQLRASYALRLVVLQHLVGRVRWVSLGAGAGLNGNENSGLSQFKRGWASGTRQVYFCGKILDRMAYEGLVKSSNLEASQYFPSYRRGEF